MNIAYQGAVNSRLQAQILGNVLSVNNVLNKKIHSIIFVGDVMLSRYIQTQMKLRGNDYNFPFALSSGFLNSADAVFGNFEGTISERGTNQGSIYSFRAGPNVISGLKSANFKIMSLANNHIWDWGADALLDTVAFLKTNGIQTVGAGGNFNGANVPAILQFGTTKIAFFAFTNLYPKSLAATQTGPGVSVFDPERLKESISELKAGNKADIVVVSFHWGDEYATSSNSLQKELAHQIIDAGADLVIGHHPHVVEESAIYKGKYIFYSLGNFVFDQNISAETMEGLAVKVLLKDNKIYAVEPVGFALNNDFQPIISQNAGVN